MKINFIGDIHLGKAISHTTDQGIKKFNKLRQDILRDLYRKDDFNVQLGDVFDSFKCSNSVLAEAVRVMERFDVSIVANHDLSNNTTIRSAIFDAFDLQPEDSKLYDLVHTKPMVILRDTTSLTLVPYHITQSSYEETLRSLERPVVAIGDVAILCLHTNVMNDFCHADIDNNLTKEMIESLLEKFDYIITGHEHNARSLYNGRVIVSGSIIPMSFAEMTDKIMPTFDTKTKQWSNEVLFSVSDNFKRVLVQEFLDMQTPMNFIEVTGEIQPSDVLPVNKKITNWFRSGEVIAIRNNTQLIKSSKTIEKVSGLSWKDMVKSKLNEQQLKAFEELDHE